MLVILSGFIFFIYILPVKLTVKFTRKQNDDFLTLAVETLFIDRQLEISYLDARQYFGSHFAITANLKRDLGQDITVETDLTKEELEKVANWLQEFNKLFDILQLISLFADNCVYFYCQMSFGLRNPGYTGIVSGGLWALKGILEGVLNNLFTFKDHPLIEIDPKFNTIKSVEMQVRSIFEFSLGNVIITGIRLLILGLRRRWQYEPTSD